MSQLAYGLPALTCQGCISHWRPFCINGGLNSAHRERWCTPHNKGSATSEFTPPFLDLPVEWDLRLTVPRLSTADFPQALGTSLCLEAGTFVYIGMYTSKSCGQVHIFLTSKITWGMTNTGP